MSLNDLSKAYEPAAVEPLVYKTWLTEKKFVANPESSGEPYCIVIPPPNVTGALHLGHAINNTLQDILIRRARMQGKNALWIPGIDHAGIATQAVVEKQLKEKEGKTRHDLGREALVKRIWEWKEKFGNRILTQLERLGCSCDWSRTHFTLDEQCARAVRETFFKLFKDGLIYRGKRLVNWDIALQTSISDDEIYHETVKTNLWHIRYPIIAGPTPSPGTPGEGRGEGTNLELRTENSELKECPHPNPLPEYRARGQENGPAFMTVATTRPETLLGDTAVAVHSEDPRWNWAIGMFVELPLTGRKIPIIADDILVDPKFGSGVVKVTPAHDPNDYAVWQRHQNKPDQIDLINILNPDGTLNENAGANYQGMKRDPARAKVVADLEAAGLLAKTEPYETQVGHSDRSKTPVEPYLSDQWFVKMAPLAEPALEVVRNGTIKFFPERHAQQYLSWLGEKRDWPISRQLWWGHRIPVWAPKSPDVYASKEFADTLEKLQRWETEDRVAFSVRNSAQMSISELSDLIESKLESLFICVRESEDQEVLTTIEQSGAFTQDPDVLDTWFSSALWPHSTLGWPDDTADLRKWYPTSVLVTAREIITLWVARMVMTGMYNMGEKQGTRDKAARDKGIQSEARAFSPSPGTPGEGRGGGSLELRTQNLALNFPHPTPPPEYQGREQEAKRLGIPFHHVHIHPVIQDGNGEPMKKSLGNGVDPVDIIDSHGADALRLTLAQMATETQDVRMAVQLVCPHCGHKIPNTASSRETVDCPKCGKPMTRPVSTARATAEAPLARSTSDRFDFGRNFCNKLWNATRFVLSSLAVAENAAKPQAASVLSPSPGIPGEGRGEGISSFILHPSSFSLADCWIISRFHHTVAEIDESLAHYRFDQYAKSVYDFFWRDFCDWYLEAAKLQLKNPATVATTANVLAACLDGALRLMHPIIPFITERLWWELNEVCPQRGTPEAPHVHGRLANPRLISAVWPSVGPFDQDAERIFLGLQEIIGAIRNLKNEHQANQKIVAVSFAVSPESSQIILDNRFLIESLAGCSITETAPNVLAAPNSSHITVAGCEILIEGLVDESAEKARIAKRREELQKQISMLKGRLGNESYVAKAPPHLIEQTRKQLADAEAELQKLS